MRYLPRYKKHTEHQKEKKKNRKEILHDIVIRTLNVQNKERILKATREKYQVIYKGRPIRITPSFSVRTLKAWMDLDGYSKTWKKPMIPASSEHYTSKTFSHNI